MKVPTLEESNCSNRKESSIKNHYPEFYEFLNEKYSHIDNYKDRICLFLHGLEDIPTCPVCGNKTNIITVIKGYHICCSRLCVNRYSVNRDKIKATKLERYGDENYCNTDKIKATKLERHGSENYNNMDKNHATKLERYGTVGYNNMNKIKATKLDRYGDERYNNMDKNHSTKLERYGDERYNNMDKNKVTCLEKYGVEHYIQTEEFKEKVKATCLEKYGVENYSQTDAYKEKVKAACLERYGTEYYTQTEAYKEKSYNTKKKNNTFNSSRIEELFNDYLIVNNIEFKSQYKSDLYPFSCDFYIPSKDLYIEIQASWTHGEHPFNENDIDDIKKLKLWQSKGTDFYKNAIYVWTVRDPLKREIAKKNGIRLLEVFSNDIEELISIFEQYFKE